MNVAVQAQLEVKKLDTAVLVVDFFVATYADGLRAVERLRKAAMDV